jgi:hypothetical protein
MPRRGLISSRRDVIFTCKIKPTTTLLEKR